MAQTIDVLIIDPLVEDAKKTTSAIKRKAPQLSTVHVLDGEQAARLMFEQGLLTRAPQIPRLIIVDLAAAGEAAVAPLRRLRGSRIPQHVPIVILSGRRNAKDILQCHLLGADMNVLKSENDSEYAQSVERILKMWQAGGLSWRALEAG